jgi:hypothetical protein
MKTKERGGKGRQISSRGFILTMAAVAIVALFVGSQLSQMTAGASLPPSSNSPTPAPSVTGANLTLNFSCGGCHAGGFDFAATPCYRQTGGWDDCNVTMWVPTLANGTCSSSVGHIKSLQIWPLSGPEPTKFFFANSDPTFPSGGPNCGLPGNLYQFWFHVIPASGHAYGSVDIYAS